MKFGLKWVHMAWYELILRQDGALWLRIILKPLLTKKRAIKIKNDPKIIPEILSIYGSCENGALSEHPLKYSPKQ